MTVGVAMRPGPEQDGGGRGGQMLEIAAKLPSAVLVGDEDRLLAQAVLRSGGARFVAREADLVRSGDRIIGWREARKAVDAMATEPNTGNSRFETDALWLREGVNCGFVLPNFAPEVERFTVAVIYRSDGEAKTLASVFTGQSNNLVFLSETEGRLLAKDKQSTVEVSVPASPSDRAKLAVLAYDGRSLRLMAGGQVALAEGRVPAMAHPGDFFIGCRSNRSGLAKTLGTARLHEVMFWPDSALPVSEAAEDKAALAALDRYFRWTY
jgi:hypothetical protein